MKTIIEEYAGSFLALLGTSLILAVLGNLLFQKDGMLTKLVEMVLEGGI